MIIVETHSVNGAVSVTRTWRGLGFATVEDARRYLVANASSSYWQSFIRDHDRRIVRAVHVRRTGKYRFFVVDSAEEDARLAAVSSHGPHVCKLGRGYPRDTGLCEVCGDVPLVSWHREAGS